jgi:hypothetical protein
MPLPRSTQKTTEVEQGMMLSRDPGEKFTSKFGPLDRVSVRPLRVERSWQGPFDGTPLTSARWPFYFAAFLAFAHRAFCAAAIFALASVLNFLLPGFGDSFVPGLLLGLPSSRAFASWSL